MAAPDEEEVELRAKMQADPKELSVYMDLVQHLLLKNRPEECIPVLLNILAIDRNFKIPNSDVTAHTTLMGLFKALGVTNEEVKKGKKALGKILL